VTSTQGTCNGCGRFCRWDPGTELWVCPGDCGREYDGPPPKSKRPKPPRDRATLSIRGGKMTIRATGRAAGVLAGLFRDARKGEP
jgi:hypothetical protein